jgi:hypothetical protein
MDFTLDVKGPNIDPGSHWLLNSIAYGKQFGAGFEKYRQGAVAGKSLEDQHEENMAQEAYNMVQKTAMLDDQEFQGLMQQIKSEMDVRPEMPERPMLQAPNLGQAATAAIGSLLFPQHALDIGATPFQNQLLEQEKGFQQAGLKYEDQQAARKERLGYLSARLNDVDTRRRQNAQQLYQLAKDAEERRDSKRAQGYTLRAKFMEASSLQEADYYAGLLRSGGYNSDVVPTDEDVRLMKEAIQGKADMAAHNNQIARQEKVVDNFRAWVSSNFPQGSSINAKDLQQINAEAARQAEVYGVPVEAFPKYTERGSLAEDRFDWEKWKFGEEQKNKAAKAEADRIAKDAKQIAGNKQKKFESINKIDAEIGKLRDEWGVEVVSPPTQEQFGYSDGLPNTAAFNKAYADWQQGIKFKVARFRSLRRAKDSILGKVTPGLSTLLPDGTTTGQYGPSMPNLNPLSGEFGRIPTGKPKTKGGVVPPKNSGGVSLPKGARVVGG